MDDQNKSQNENWQINKYGVKLAKMYNLSHYDLKQIEECLTSEELEI